MYIDTVSVIGLGALGTMYADHFWRTLPPHSLRVVADAERIDRYRTRGVFVNDHGCNFDYVEPQVTGDPADLVIFAVKYPGLARAMEDAANQIGPNTTIISVLNGIASEQALAKRFGEEKVLMCVAQEMDAVHKGSFTEYKNFGRLAIGCAQDTPEQRERLEALRDFFDDTNLPYIVPDDIYRQQWSKLVCNTGVNQACMVYDCSYAGIQQPGEARDAMIAAMREAVAVGRAEGIDLSEDDVAFWADGILMTLNPDGFPSMKQDADAHRPSEVELFGGTICALGQKHGIATPTNDAFVKKIQEMESAY